MIAVCVSSSLKFTDSDLSPHLLPEIFLHYTLWCTSATTLILDQCPSYKRHTATASCTCLLELKAGVHYPNSRRSTSLCKHAFHIWGLYPFSPHLEPDCRRELMLFADHWAVQMQCAQTRLYMIWKQRYRWQTTKRQPSSCPTTAPNFSFSHCSGKTTKLLQILFTFAIRISVWSMTIINLFEPYLLLFHTTKSLFILFPLPLLVHH